MNATEPLHVVSVRTTASSGYVGVAVSSLAQSNPGERLEVVVLCADGLSDCSRQMFSAIMAAYPHWGIRPLSFDLRRFASFRSTATISKSTHLRLLIPCPRAEGDRGALPGRGRDRLRNRPCALGTDLDGVVAAVVTDPIAIGFEAIGFSTGTPPRWGQ